MTPIIDRTDEGEWYSLGMTDCGLDSMTLESHGRWRVYARQSYRVRLVVEGQPQSSISVPVYVRDGLTSADVCGVVAFVAHWHIAEAVESVQDWRAVRTAEISGRRFQIY